MNRRINLSGLVLLVGLTGCGDPLIESMSDGTDTESSEDSTDESGGGEVTTQADTGDGDGDGDGTTGDGDGTATGDGDGTTTGDGDGDGSTTGDGDGTATGDGDGDGTATGDGDGTATGDGDGTTTGDGDGTTTGDGDGTTTGDGDGTTTGDGDGTTTGDGDGTTTGDGDGTTTGDGDGTTIGDGDGTTAGDGDGTTTGDGDGTTTGDGDGTTTGDGDGDGTTTGDGDGTTTGDGDGTTTGDGDGTTTGDGDGTTTGDGDGDGDKCGNTVVDPPEECDLPDLDGADCTDFGFEEPNGLSCTGGCLFDPSGCQAECGNQIPEPGEECDDGNGNPADGCDDCRVTGTLCSFGIPIELDLGTVTHSYTTVGGGLHQTSQCSTEAASADRVYTVTPQSDGFLTVWLDPGRTDYDSVLYALNDCLSLNSGILCADRVTGGVGGIANGGEVISFDVFAGEAYWIVVDGANGAEGGYEVAFDLSVGTCGDPVPFPLWFGNPMQGIGNSQGGGSAAGHSCGGSGPEIVYAVQPGFDAPVDGTIIGGQTGFDSVAAARSSCSDGTSEIDCDSGGGDDRVTFAGSSVAPTFVFVDSDTTDPGGDYLIEFGP